MFYHRSKCLWKFVKYNDFSYMDFPQLYNAKIRCSKYGWLLMSHDDGSLFFFDPFKEQRIRELPKHKYPYTTICFFNEPTSTNCIVVGISNVLNTHKVIMGVLKHRKDEWKVNIYNRTRSEFRLSLCTPILHCGKLYSLDVKGNVATFDMNGHDNGPSWHVYNNGLFPSWIPNKIEHQFLIKLEEEVLFAVFVAHDIRKVSVYRSKLRKENCMVRWVLVKDLGDKAFFVSDTASFAVTACSESMANKIYFTKFHGDSGVYFSLKTQKYHSFNGDFSSHKCDGLKELDFATWILPTISWRMLTKD